MLLATSSYLILVVMPLLLVAMPGATKSFLFLHARHTHISSCRQASKASPEQPALSPTHQLKAANATQVLSSPENRTPRQESNVIFTVDVFKVSVYWFLIHSLH